MALHCTGQADAEWLRRELQRPPARRVPQGAPVRKPHRGARHHRRMEERLQNQPTALEPQRANTNRVRSSPQGGAKLEQTLLMIEGKLGSRSGKTCSAWLTVHYSYVCKRALPWIPSERLPNGNPR